MYRLPHIVRHVLILALVAGLPVPSVAQVRSTTEALIARGTQLREAGNARAALRSFEAAAQLERTPRVIAQLGLTEQALEQWFVAERHLTGALSARSDAWIQEHREMLEGALAAVQAHLGSLELLGGVEGASVRIDGAPAGTLPLAKPLRVLAGSLNLEVDAPGFQRLARTIVVPESGLVREILHMVPQPVADAVSGTMVIAPALDEAKPSACPAGKSVSPDTDGHCCWPGQVWIPTSERCGGMPICPEGYRITEDDCVLRVAAETADFEAWVPGAATGDAAQPHAAHGTSRFRPEGFEAGVHVGVTNVLDRSDRLLRRDTGSDGTLGNLGPTLELYGGYRVARWFSFGLHGQSAYLFSGGDTSTGAYAYDRVIAGSAGAYVRGHTASSDQPNTIDVWVMAGFHPLARMHVFTDPGPYHRVQALAVPVKLGATWQAHHSFGLEAAIGITAWYPLKYCIGAGQASCVDDRRYELTSGVSLGVSWF